MPTWLVVRGNQIRHLSHCLQESIWGGGMYLSGEELRAVQQTELEMLVEIDRICRKN